MIPILFPADATTYGTNGLGRLAECIRCEVTEERNGIYELEMELPITAKHYAEIEEGMIVSVIHDDTKTRQPFIIYRRTAPINGIVTFYAHHVSYLLSGIVLRPYTAATCAEALALMPTYSMSTNPFTFWTDKQTTASFKVEVPTGCRQQLAGIRGSVLDVFGGGEYEFDNFTVKLYQNRGTDSGVQIRYGKNLLDIEKEVDVSGIAGGVVGWWKGGEVGSETVVFTPVIYASGYGAGAPVLSLDLSGDFTEAPSVSALTAKVNQYIADQKPQEPSFNVKVDFVALWQTPEYKNIAPLERVRLCDTVHVIYDALGVNVESKVIKTKYNVLTERYEEIELGQPKTNFTEKITAKTEELLNAVPTRSMIQAAVDHATELITGGLGGHVVMTLNADGEPQEILIMDTDDTSTAVNVIRINQAGIGFSTTGYNGPFTSAWTIDGHFVADFIDTGTLDAALITVGTMLADRILGGTLKVGGSGNGNGVIQVYDANDNLIGTIDRNGANLTGDLISQKASGQFEVKSQVGTVSSPLYATSSSSDGIRWVDRLGSIIDFVFHGNSSIDYYAKRGHYYTGYYFYHWNYADVPTTEAYLNYSSNKGIIVEYGNNKIDIYYINNITGGSNNETKHTLANDHLDLKHYTGSVYDFKVYIDDYIDVEGCTGSQTNYIKVGKYSATDEIDITSGSNRVYLGPSSSATSFATMLIKSSNSEILGNASALKHNGNTLQYASSSSKRYKNSIEPISDKDLDPHKLLDLPVVQFRYNDGEKLQYADMAGKQLPGLIAEDVAEIYPAAVIHDPETGEVETWDERRIIPGMLALIQEQQKRIEDLEARIEKMSKQIHAFYSDGDVL